jgi:hypothetical protein
MAMTTATSGGVARNSGGVAIGVTTSTGSAITSSLAIRTLNPAGEKKANRVQASSGGAQNIATATAGGRLSYDPVREFIMHGFSTKINGTASTVLATTATPSGSKRKPVQGSVHMLGVAYRTAIAAGYWRPLGIANQRTLWSTAPTTMATTNYKSTTNAATTAVDKAVPSLAVPGNLVYRTGAPNVVIKAYAPFFGI